MALLTDQILATGVSSTDLIHIVVTGDTSQNPAGSSFKASILQVATAIGSPGFSGGTVPYDTYFSSSLSANTFSATTYLNLPGSTSGNCFSDFYVSNIHSCSQLNINPLDEGPVVFGQSKQLVLDLSAKRVGINTTPIYTIDAVGALNGSLYWRNTPASSTYRISGNSSSIVSYTLFGENFLGLDISLIGSNSISPLGSLTSGDTYIRTYGYTNNLVFVTEPFAPAQKDIRFWAGKIPDTKPDLRVIGTGATRGYVEVSTNLLVGSKTSTENFQMTSGSSQGYVLIDSDGNGNAQWKNPNTLTKSWGSFISTNDQSVAVAGVTYKMSADTTNGSSGVTVSGGSRFVISNPGVYNIQFSAQLNKSSGTNSSAFIWLSKNGTPVPSSNTEIYLPGGSNERFVAAWNWVEEVTTPNTYFEIEWTDNQNNVFLDYVASPTYGPAIPSLIVTVTQV